MVSSAAAIRDIANRNIIAGWKYSQQEIDLNYNISVRFRRYDGSTVSVNAICLSETACILRDFDQRHPCIPSNH